MLLDLVIIPRKVKCYGGWEILPGIWGYPFPLDMGRGTFLKEEHPDSIVITTNTEDIPLWEENHES